MFLIDDIVLAPIHGIMWVFRKIHEATLEDRASEGEAITEELRNLYMMLETKRITEEQFDAREKELLDRLDEIEARNSSGEEDADEEASGENEEDEDTEDDGDDDSEEDDEADELEE